jgi:hypothetical protein
MKVTSYHAAFFLLPTALLDDILAFKAWRRRGNSEIEGEAAK